MPKWRWLKRGGGDHAPSSPPSPEAEITLPDPQDADEALAKAAEGKQSSEELGVEVREMLRALRWAREKNGFAEGIVEMIRQGR